MKKIRTRIAVVVLGLTLMVLMMTGCSSLRSETEGRTELIVSAAASLTDSLKEIQAAFEEQHRDIRLILNFGSSGTLQQQIEQGAPSDLFLSAGKKQMAALLEKHHIDEGWQTALLSNELVLIVPSDQENSVHSLADLSSSTFERLAIGEPDTVPAGGYAMQTLEQEKLWGELKQKLVYAKDVRQVITYVETGNAEAGFVYKTDAVTSTKVKIASIIDANSHEAIEYPVGIVKSTKHMKEAQAFYDYLQSEQAQSIFAKFGFSQPNERGNG